MLGSCERCLLTKSKLGVFPFDIDIGAVEGRTVFVCDVCVALSCFVDMSMNNLRSASQQRASCIVRAIALTVKFFMFFALLRRVE